MFLWAGSFLYGTVRVVTVKGYVGTFVAVAVISSISIATTATWSCLNFSKCCMKRFL